MTAVRWALIAILLAILALPGQAFAGDFVDVPIASPSIDLSSQLKFLDTEKRSIPIQLPVRQGEDRQFMTLEARGNAPVHRWAVVSLRNLGYLPVEAVLVIPYQGFVGSGIFWPKNDGTRVARVMVSRGASPSVVNDIGSDAMAIRVEPSSTVTVAFQLAGDNLEGTELWQRAAFDARTDSRAFFRGAILGIAILMTVVMLALYAVRSSVVFPIAALFGAASVGFIAIETGYLPIINAALPEQLKLDGKAGVVVEGLMLTGMILCIVTFLELRRRRPAVAQGLIAAAILSLALPVYGWFEPAKAIAIIRVAFAIFAIGGFILVISLWRQGVTRAQASLLSWSTLVSWTLVAAVALFSGNGQAVLRPILVAGLTLVLLTMAFTLAQFAFSHGFLSRRFFEEAGRRALALAGSQQFVWDWQVDEQDLYIGEELERAIGLAPGFFSEQGIDGLLELIHPLDRRSYLSAVENAERRGKGAFSQDFRMRGGDGAYRWFELRARVMSGADRRAMRCIGTLTDITARKRSEDRLLSDAVYDRVTELPNRALLIDRLDRAISQRESGEGGELYLLMIDIDRFKSLNDGLGHEAGDHILNVTGKRILGVAGPNDTVARMPGDQFAVIFTGNPQRDIVEFTERIRMVISRAIPMRPRDVALTASIGVAGHRHQGQHATHMIRDAAVALYEAKRRGKDAVEFFRPSMRDERSELVALEQDLVRAVERSEIEVFYQPVARLADMDLAGFEALIRWRHPIHGLLAPESFISIAEQSGLIRELGRHVLNEAARQLGIWQRAFRPGNPIFVAVNLSSGELLRTDLIEHVKTILVREGIARDTFKIEVTESIVMANPELGARILEKLKDLGVGLACDDFGTGFSSLSTLRRLPFDTLKIDRSFIEAEPEDQRSGVILSMITSLAAELGMKIVAEGITTQGQVDRLAGLGCEYGQGYFIGQPMPAKQVTDALSGLPYASNRGKSPIAALWERMRAEHSVPIHEVEADDTVEQPLMARAYIEPEAVEEPEAEPVENRGNWPAEEPEAEPVEELVEMPVEAEENVADTVTEPVETEEAMPAYEEPLPAGPLPSRLPPPALGTAPLAPRPSKPPPEPAAERKVVYIPAPRAPRLPKPELSGPVVPNKAKKAAIGKNGAKPPKQKGTPRKSRKPVQPSQQESVATKAKRKPPRKKSTAQA